MTYAPAVPLQRPRVEVAKMPAAMRRHLCNGVCLCKSFSSIRSVAMVCHAYRMRVFSVILFYLNQSFNKRGSKDILNDNKIERMLTKISSELYPKQPEVVFSGTDSLFQLINL